MSETLAVLDQQKAIQLVSGNKELANDLLAMLIKELPEYKQNIQKELQNQNKKELRKIIHKIHGGLRYLGAPALMDIISQTDHELFNLSDEQLKAFKAGAMVALRNQVNRNKTTFSKLADDDAQFGAALRTILGGTDDNFDDLVRKLDLAGDTAQIAQKVKPEAGSPTAQLQRELKNQGLDVSAADFLDPVVGFMRAGIKVLKRDAPELNDAERLKVIQTIFTQEPKVAFKALNDEKLMEKLVKKYSRVGRGAGVYAGTAATSQATQPEGLLNSLIVP